LLEYLSNIKAPSNHTIPLLDVIDLSIGKTIIVLPWKSPLDEGLQFRDHPDPDNVVSLSVAFSSLKAWPFYISTGSHTVISNLGM
jgi:hypothetical protein